MQGGEVILILLAIALGLATFVLSSFVLLWRLFRGVGRLVVRPFRARPHANPAHARMRRVCRNPECRKVEERPALYCSRCGRALPR
jgi:hypothetical protein